MDIGEIRTKTAGKPTKKAGQNSEMSAGAREKTETVRFLESYGINRRMLEMMRYEKQFEGETCADELGADFMMLPGGDEVLLKNRMYVVRRLIMSLGDSDEKTLLFYHYIKGYPVEKCALVMNISRTSAFRLKKKALEMAEKNRGKDHIASDKHLMFTKKSI